MSQDRCLPSNYYVPGGVMSVRNSLVFLQLALQCSLHFFVLLVLIHVFVFATYIAPPTLSTSTWPFEPVNRFFGRAAAFFSSLLSVWYFDFEPHFGWVGPIAAL